MSNPPNNNPGGLGHGLGPGGANPALLNANAILANLGQGNGAVPGSSQQIAGGSGLTPEQIRLLTDFHRQQAPMGHSAPTQAPPVVAAPPVPAHVPAPVRPQLPQHILRHIHNQEMTPADRSAFLTRWMQTEEGRQVAAQHRQMQIAQAAQAQALAQQQGSPNRAPVGLPGAPGTGTDTRSGSSGSPQKPPGSLGMAPSSSHLHPALSSSPSHSVASLPGGPEQAQSLQAGPRVQPAPAPAPAPGSSRPGSSSGPKGPFLPGPGPSQPPQPPQQHFRRPANSPEPTARPAPTRRREEGMRGTMRAELARLMYASGDVENPDLDSIDYMEDLVVDWLADLCAPPPPVRAHPSAPLIAPRLDYDVIRHRLSRPSMRKYLDRFEYMEYKAIDMRSARRVAKGDYEPVDQRDLDGQLEQGFLAGDDVGAAAGPGGSQEARKKRKYQFHNRVPTGGSTSTTAPTAGGDKERKKPGPKKGWKAALTPEERERAKKARRARQSTTGSTSVKPEQQ